MEKKRSLGLLLFLLFLLASREVMVGTEARKCQSQSHKFKGPCMVDRNCANVCATEGFTGGDCHGLRRRCFCTRDC